VQNTGIFRVYSFKKSSGIWWRWRALPALLVLAVVLIVLLIHGAVPVQAAVPENGSETMLNKMVRGRVLTVEEGTGREEGNPRFEAPQRVTVEITEGPFKGEVYTLENYLSGIMALDIQYRPGDRVILSMDVEDGKITGLFLADLAREGNLTTLTTIFLLLLVVVGGLQGIKGILSLGLIGLGILKILLPGLLRGMDAIWLTVGMITVVTALTLLIIGGLNRKSIAAIIGTVGGVVIAGMVAKFSISAARLTGLGLEEAQMLQFIPQQVQFNYQGLLFAAMVIGALGAIMDMGMSIASAVTEVYRANPGLGVMDLFRSGLNVGRDVIGTMSNTLILAYTGGALPLLLLLMAYEMPLIKMLNMDMIASEIVRALAGSIGIVLAVPLTAMVAGILTKR